MLALKALTGVAVLVAVGLLVNSCKDMGNQVTTSPGTNDGDSVSFANQIQPILTQSCVNAGCHPGGGAPFSLQAGTSYNNLVNVPAVAGPCAGIPRVKPFSADSSALYRRIKGTCGSRMPLGGSPLPSDERDLIENWIGQGARNN